MNWKHHMTSMWLLVTDDGHILDEINRLSDGTFRVASTGHRYISLEAAQRSVTDADITEEQK